MKKIFAAALLLCFGFCSWVGADTSQPYVADRGLLIPGYLLVFDNSAGPLSFETMTPGDLAKWMIPAGPVEGRGCQYGISIPLSLTLQSTKVSVVDGKGGYAKAMAMIRKSHPDAAGIYDVKVDTHLITVLGIFSEECVEVAAQSFRLEGANAPAKGEFYGR